MTNRAEIDAAIRDVARAGGARRAILFGSWARGTATRRSDVDVLVVEETQARFLDRLGKYAYPLFDRLRTPVEVIVYTSEEFERRRELPFLRRILREGVTVYEYGAATG